MKRGDLVKHRNAPWYGVITRVKRFKDPPAGLQHVELVWFDYQRSNTEGGIDTIASSLLLLVSES